MSESETNEQVVRVVSRSRIWARVAFIITVLCATGLYFTGREGGSALLWIAFFLLLCS